MWTEGVSRLVTFQKVNVGLPHVWVWAHPSPPKRVQGAFCTQCGSVRCIGGRGGGLLGAVRGWHIAPGGSRAICPGFRGNFISWNTHRIEKAMLATYLYTYDYTPCPMAGLPAST